MTKNPTDKYEIHYMLFSDEVYCKHTKEMTDHADVIMTEFAPLVGLIESNTFGDAYNGGSAMTALTLLLTPPTQALVTRGYWLKELRVYRERARVLFTVVFKVPIAMRRHDACLRASRP